MAERREQEEMKGRRNMRTGKDDRREIGQYIYRRRDTGKGKGGRERSTTINVM